jgi:hypothetical protein
MWHGVPPLLLPKGSVGRFHQKKPRNERGILQRAPIPQLFNTAHFQNECVTRTIGSALSLLPLPNRWFKTKDIQYQQRSPEDVSAVT